MRAVLVILAILCFAHAWFLAGTWNQIIGDVSLGAMLAIVELSLPGRSRNVETGMLPRGPRAHDQLDKPYYVEQVHETHTTARVPTAQTGETAAVHFQTTTPAWMTDPAMRREWAKQDLIGAAASYYAATGGVTDDEVRADIVAIQHLPLDQQHNAFDLLAAKVINGHPDGWIAKVYQEVSRAHGDSVMEYDRRRDEFEGKDGS